MRERVDRYVDTLLRKKRPKPFAPTQAEIEMLAVAIDLSAGSPNDAEPRPAFIDQLRRRIEQQQQAEQVPSTQPAWRTSGRRRLLATGALTVSGAAAGIASTRLVSLGAAAAPAAEPAELTPTHGAWQTVADSAGLPEGAVTSFDLGPITGFVRRTAGRVQAVSAVCTHQGCQLELTAARDQIACPCHGATFDLAGMNLTRPRQMDHPLPPLPRLAVREQNGRIQVYAPAPPASTRPPGRHDPDSSASAHPTSDA